MAHSYLLYIFTPKLVRFNLYRLSMKSPLLPVFPWRLARWALCFSAMSFALGVVARAALVLVAAQGDSTASPRPTAAQLAWHDLETYAFIHYGLNTYTDAEWGYGDASPALFDPDSLDCRQWVRALKAGGLKGVILTAKHHDGFCLWPSRDNPDYSIARTPYYIKKARAGRAREEGDIVGWLSRACREEGLHFGLYLSPWDRHRADYASDSYVDYYHRQLTDLLSHYGPLFEVWFDGANGGDGYYGGAREKRRIDATTYYRFPQIYQLVDSLQPNAIIFSDAGPGCRWVGNERGHAGQTCWARVPSGVLTLGTDKVQLLGQGQADGDLWIPAECDVSIRPGWFWHAQEDAQVKQPAELFDIYLKSVGRGGTMLLNVPVNRHGRISAPDIAALRGFRQLREQAFARDILADATLAAADNTLTYSLPAPASIRFVVLEEDIRQGQHIEAFHVAYRPAGQTAFLPLPTAEATTTIGHKRILPLTHPVSADALRVAINAANGPAVIRSVAAF